MLQWRRAREGRGQGWPGVRALPCPALPWPAPAPHLLQHDAPPRPAPPRPAPPRPAPPRPAPPRPPARPPTCCSMRSTSCGLSAPGLPPGKAVTTRPAASGPGPHLRLMPKSLSSTRGGSRIQSSTRKFDCARGGVGWGGVGWGGVGWGGGERLRNCPAAARTPAIAPREPAPQASRHPWPLGGPCWLARCSLPRACACVTGPLLAGPPPRSRALLAHPPV
jgi:hypothetical protein